MTNPNDFAFNTDLTQLLAINENEIRVSHPPLSKREYFAAMALQGLLADKWSNCQNPDQDGYLAAKVAVNYADALITALNN